MSDSSTTLQKKVCMLGAFAVGKTSLVSRFVKSIFSETYQTTVGAKVDKKTVEVGSKTVNLMLWDLAGEDELQKVRDSYLRGASGYLLVVDGTRPDTLKTAIELQQRVQSAIGEVAFLTLVNKADLSDEWQLSEDDLEPLTSQHWQVMKTSAKTGDGVEEAFLRLAQMILGDA